MDIPKSGECYGLDDLTYFKEVFDKYHPILYTLALNILNDAEEAKDIVQNIFLKFWNNRSVFQSIPKENILNYLYTMTKNSVLSGIKRKKIEQKVYSERKREIVEDSTYERIFMTEKYRHVEEFVSTLSPIKQKIVNLKREGFSNIQIAQKLNLSVNTVKSHYAVVLKKMRESLQYLSMIVILINAL